MSTIPNPDRDDPEVALLPWVEELRSDPEGAGTEPVALDQASSPGLVDWRVLTGLIRRSVRIWGITALIGVLAGSALFIKSPASAEAATSVMLVYGPYENITTAPSDSVALAESRAVAARAIRDLNLRSTVDAFLGTYTVQLVSNRVLSLKITAPSATEAVSRANALASAFLEFRAQQLRQSEALVKASLDSQISTAKGELASVDEQIAQASAGSASQTRQSRVSSLQDERTRLSTIVNSLEQSASAGQAHAATDLAVQGSQVLDAAAASTPSHSRRLVLFVGAGLIVGLTLGMGGALIRGVVSDRLRRRDDVAQALGIPVRLTVGRIRVPRRISRIRRHKRSRLGHVRGGRVRLNRDPNVDRLVAHLRGAAHVAEDGLMSLAVVPVDDPRVAAASVVALAVSYAEAGKRVIVADLVRGVPTAAHLKVPNPGVQPVIVNGATVVTAVPNDEELLPAGPFEGGSPWVLRAEFTNEVIAVCRSADVLLTLTSVDPSLGADHLPTWTTAAVVVVTAGRSSSTRLSAVGELLRNTNVQVLSGVLVGGDKTDETLGMPQRVVTLPEASSRWNNP